MDILMVLEHDYPEDERVTKEIKTLQGNGHNVILACCTLQNKKAHEFINGIEVFRKNISRFTLKKTSVGALKFPFYFNFWSSFINTILNEMHFDSIHIHDLPLAKVGYNLSRKYNIKFVLDLHENWPVLLDLSPHTKTILGRLLSSQKQWLEYEKRYATLADGLIVVTEGMKERLLRKGVINKNIVVIPNTSNVYIFQKYNNIIPDKKYVTLYYAGGITKHRGLKIVIQGIAKMKLPDNFRFWIIGRGRNRQNLEIMTKKLNLEDKVSFLGWKHHNMVLELLFKSDIAVIPHLRSEHTDNTSPNKLFHYMLAGKPILSSDCKYLKKIIEETNAGLIYTDKNIKDFCEKLSKLISDKNLRTQLGKNGKKTAIEKYNWAKTSKSLIKLYSNIS